MQLSWFEYMRDGCLLQCTTKLDPCGIVPQHKQPYPSTHHTQQIKSDKMHVQTPNHAPASAVCGFEKQIWK